MAKPTKKKTKKLQKKRSKYFFGVKLRGNESFDELIQLGKNYKKNEKRR